MCHFLEYSTIVSVMFSSPIHSENFVTGNFTRCSIEGFLGNKQHSCSLKSV